MRARGDAANMVFTAETAAEQFGVVKSSYEAVPLPGVKAKYGSVVNTEGVVRASGAEPGGADVVLDALVRTVLSQPHVKKAIPGSTDAVLKAIVETRGELVSRKQPPVLTLEQFVSMCVTAGVTSGSAIHLSLTLSESFGEVLATGGVSEEDINKAVKFVEASTRKKAKPKKI